MKHLLFPFPCTFQTLGVSPPPLNPPPPLPNLKHPRYPSSSVLLQQRNIPTENRFPHILTVFGQVKHYSISVASSSKKRTFSCTARGKLWPPPPPPPWTRPKPEALRRETRLKARLEKKGEKGTLSCCCFFVREIPSLRREKRTELRPLFRERGGRRRSRASNLSFSTSRDPPFSPWQPHFSPSLPRFLLLSHESERSDERWCRRRRRRLCAERKRAVSPCALRCEAPSICYCVILLSLGSSERNSDTVQRVRAYVQRS